MTTPFLAEAETLHDELVSVRRDLHMHPELGFQEFRTAKMVAEKLGGLGYEVPESQANFVWCTGGPPAAEVYERLKERRILVRLMRYPGQPDGLRVTVGTDAEIDQFLAALRAVL